jgi:hypothetical protein
VTAEVSDCKRNCPRILIKERLIMFNFLILFHADDLKKKVDVTPETIEELGTQIKGMLEGVSANN